MKAFVIAAPHSGSGKTTITIGLMEVLRRRGLTVAPFKVGPDFIDPGYHRLVTHRPSINLDGWMCTPERLQESFDRYSRGADIAVVEGVMGLYDGFGGRSESGSTAQVAKLLHAPVLLVIDARGQARSVAATVKGFLEFDPDLDFAGIIFNQVGSDNHAAILKSAVDELGYATPVLGCIPSDSRLAIPSRHLGLVTAEDNPLPGSYLEYLGAVIRENVDLASLWSLAAVRYDYQDPELPYPVSPAVSTIKIAVARDEAFCFVYEENLNMLSEAGAELIPFSPIHDSCLPEGISGIYLPGGYPELFALQLAENMEMKSAVADAINDGMPVYAECGGFIYLTRGVIPADGRIEAVNSFVGVFPVSARMLGRRKALGYREVEFTADSIIAKKGVVARGHEFHYSEISEMPPEIERVYMTRRGSSEVGPEGYIIRNCLASYIHIHFGSCPGMASEFVGSCRKYSQGLPN